MRRAQPMTKVAMCRSAVTKQPHTGARRGRHEARAQDQTQSTTITEKLWLPRAREGALVGIERAGPLLAALQRVAQVVPGGDVAGLQIHGAPEVGHRQLRAVHAQVRIPQRIVHLHSQVGRVSNAPHFKLFTCVPCVPRFTGKL